MRPLRPTARQVAANQRRRAAAEAQLGTPVAWAALVVPAGRAFARSSLVYGLALGGVGMLLLRAIRRRRSPFWRVPTGVFEPLLLAATPKGIAVLAADRRGRPGRLLDTWPTGSFAAEVWEDSRPVRLAVVLADGRELRAECGAARATRGDAAVLPWIRTLARPGAAALPPGFPPPPVATPPWRAPLIAGAVVLVLFTLGFLGAVASPGHHAVVSTPAAPVDPADVPGSGVVRITDLQVGQCYDGATQGQTFDLNSQPCQGPHGLQVVANLPVAGATFPGHDALAAAGKAQCLDAARAFVTAPEVRTFFVGYYLPLEKSWDLGDRTITCFVNSANDAPLTADLRAAS